ncbi:hypothetical protein [Acinetobacter baumannii]|nr:hypothetical protein [Acinetobacter baumannii]CQR88984.1 hypothetical protein [Acinetobacter baumannii]
MGRFHAVGTTEGGRDTDRTTLIAAYRHVHFASRHQCGAAGGRTAGGIAMTMGIVHRGRVGSVAAAGEAEVLAGGFAENRRPGIQQAGGHGRVVGWDETFERGGAVHHRYAGERDIVFQSDGPPGQRASRCTFYLRFVIPGIERIVLASRTIAGGARIADLRDIVGKGVDQIVSVEVSLHHRQIFLGLRRRQADMQTTGKLLELFGSGTLNSHVVSFFCVCSCACLEHKPGMPS